MVFLRTLVLLLQDLQYLISLFTRFASSSIWLSEESFYLLQRGHTLSSFSRTSVLVCVVTLSTYEANKVNERLLLRSGDQGTTCLFKDCRKTLLEVRNKKTRKKLDIICFESCQALFLSFLSLTLFLSELPIGWTA